MPTSRPRLRATPRTSYALRRQPTSRHSNRGWRTMVTILDGAFLRDDEPSEGWSYENCGVELRLDGRGWRLAAHGSSQP